MNKNIILWAIAALFAIAATSCSGKSSSETAEADTAT